MDLFRHTTELGSHVSSDVRLVSLGLFGEWFEPRGISYLFSVIVRVRVVFRKTNNSLFTDYPHPNDHAKQIGLQLFTSFGVQLACEFLCSFEALLVVLLLVYIISSLYRWKAVLATRTGCARVLYQTSHAPAT